MIIMWKPRYYNSPGRCRFGSRENRNIKILLLLAATLLLCVLAAVLCYSAEAANHVVINEVCSNNFSVICDENGYYSDYVELYNPALVPVSITGFSLSDSEDELSKCILDSVVIPAKGYFLVWLDGSDGDVVGHAAFKLSSKGENLYLSNSYGRITDSVEVPALTYNTVYARACDGSLEWGRKTPSANASNNQSEDILKVELEKPVLSVESGFYEESFELQIQAGANQIIYYTLDGSNPTTNSQVYTEPIKIIDASLNENIYSARTDLSAAADYVPNFKVDKGTVVRAMAFSPEEKTVSEIVTKIYFVGFEKKQEYEGYAVLSLVTDPDNLFDAEKGIYANGKALEEYESAAGVEDGQVPDTYIDEEGNVCYKYMSTNAYNTGKEWEREADIIYFDQDHERIAQQKVGIRISGQSTRNAIQKSFNLFAREIYDGSEKFSIPFFDDMNYSTVKLRNGGTDHEKSKIYDPFLHSLSEGRSVAVQASTPCVVFLNGEYWGIYNIRERFKEDYFQNHFGIGEGNIWMIDSGTPAIGDWEAWNNYNEMIEFISENDMTIEENYEKACELVDIQSLIDFYCIQLYIDNDDVGFDKNIALWRSARVDDGEYEDGKWRFMLYDLDGALNSPEKNTFMDSEWWKEDFNLMDEGMIKSLLKNKEFRQRFIESFQEIANENFDYDTVHESLMQWKEQYQAQAVRSHQRFISADASAEDYNAYIEHIDNFFRVRYAYIMKYLEEEMRAFDS